MLRVKSKLIISLIVMAGCASTSNQRYARTDHLTSGSSGTVSIEADSSLCYNVIVEMPDHEALDSVLDMARFKTDLASEMAGSAFVVATSSGSERIVIEGDTLDRSVINYSDEVSYVLRSEICGTDKLAVDYDIASSAEGSRYVVVIEVDPAHFLY
jgi:uncharacterized protein YceK